MCFSEEIDRIAYETVDVNIMSESSNQVAIYTDGFLMNFVPVHGKVDPDGIKFTTYDTIFSKPELTKELQLEVETYF